MLFPILALLVVFTGWLGRRSIRRIVSPRPRGLTDEMIAQIERYGTVTLDEDEPLDEERIRREEERFWNESAWEEPERF